MFGLNDRARAAARAADCFQTSILSPAPFLGNHDEVVKLSDGSLWQVQNEYNYSGLTSVVSC